MTVLSGEVDLQQQLAELERVAIARRDDCPDAIHVASLCNDQEFMTTSEEIALASLSSPDSVSTVSTNNSFKSAISDIPCHHGPCQKDVVLEPMSSTTASSESERPITPPNGPIDTARIAVKSSSSSAHEDAAIECNKLNLDSEDAASLSIRLVDQNAYSTSSSTSPKLQSSVLSSKPKQSFKTYADVYNAVQADPAAAPELLTQPLCNETSLHLASSPINKQLSSKDEANSPKPLEPKMPEHSTTQPNWAMAPDEPEFNSSPKTTISRTYLDFNKPSSAKKKYRGPRSTNHEQSPEKPFKPSQEAERYFSPSKSRPLTQSWTSYQFKASVAARSSPAPLTAPEDQFPAHISKELHCVSGHLPFLDRQMENDDFNHYGVPIPSWDVPLFVGQQNLVSKEILSGNLQQLETRQDWRDHAHGQAAAMPDLSQISLSHQSQAASHSEEIWEAKASTGWDELATSNDFLHPRMPSGTHIQGQQDWQKGEIWEPSVSLDLDEWSVEQGHLNHPSAPAVTHQANASKSRFADHSQDAQLRYISEQIRPAGPHRDAVPLRGPGENTDWARRYF